MFNGMASGADYWRLWRTRFISNVVAAAAVVPVIVSWAGVSLARLRRVDSLRVVEAGFLLIGLLAVCIPVFESQAKGAGASALLYVPVPFLLWAALRFGPLVTTTSFMVVAFAAIWGAGQGKGPFVTGVPAEGALTLQLFLIFVAATLLVLMAIVNERRRLEQQLRDSEELYREVVESQTELVCRYLPDTTLTFVNEAYCRFFGRRREELIGRKFVELMPEAARQEALSHVASLASDPRPRTYEHQVLAPDGSVRWQQWVDHPIVQPDGRIAEFQGIGRDVSDRKRTEETLLDSEERLQLALEAGGMGVWDWDVRSNTMLWSKEHYTIMGLEPFSVDLTHRTWAGLVHPEDLPLAERAMEKALAEGTGYQCEYRVVRPDGSVTWIEARGHPIHENGRCVRVMGLVVDVTDRKRGQEADQKLAHASRLSVVGELTASIAHEINQPLGAILSNADAAEMLLESGTARLAEVRHILEDIRKDDVRASEVVRRIRRLLQKHEFEIQPYDLNEVVADVVRLVSADAIRRNIAIATNLAQLPILHGDRVQMLQVLLNVILNGLDAMAATPDGRRLITIRTARGAEGGVEISITDAGHGIPPDRLPRIFESFYTTKKDGMGLGLSIARSTVEQHGGRIRAANNDGGGATFRITLPVDAAKARS